MGNSSDDAAESFASENDDVVITWAGRAGTKVSTSCGVERPYIFVHNLQSGVSEMFVLGDSYVSNSEADQYRFSINDNLETNTTYQLGVGGVYGVNVVSAPTFIKLTTKAAAVDLVEPVVAVTTPGQVTTVTTPGQVTAATSPEEVVEVTQREQDASTPAEQVTATSAEQTEATSVEQVTAI